jgi:hypothetical protein
LDDDSANIAPKTPKLDSNSLFEQLRASETAVAGIKECFKEALTIGENCYSSTDGGQGEAFFKLAKTVEPLIINQENIFSLMVDTVGLSGKTSASSYSSVSQPRGRQSGGVQLHKPDPAPQADPRPRKIRQAIAKAEKSVTLFDLDLGTVPVLNKDTLFRKVTILLHDKAKTTGIYKDNPAAASEIMDDILSCALIEFLGKGTRSFYNRHDTSDPRNNKMCTVPVKLTFRDKETRFRAELTLKKACKVRCGTPYPKKLRSLMDSLIKDCKASRPKSFILAKVDTENLCITARARSDSGWDDLPAMADIPLDLLDEEELSAVSAGSDEAEMVPIS